MIDVKMAARTRPGRRRGNQRACWRAHLAAFTSTLEWLGAAILAALFLVVMAAVIRRYVFGGGFVWSDELAIWLHVALIAIGAPLAVTGALVDAARRARAAPAGARAEARGVLADAHRRRMARSCSRSAAPASSALVGGTSTVLGLPEWLRFAVFALGGGLTVLVAARARRARPGLARCAGRLFCSASCSTGWRNLRPACSSRRRASLAGARRGGSACSWARRCRSPCWPASRSPAPSAACCRSRRSSRTPSPASASSCCWRSRSSCSPANLLTDGGLAERLVRFAAALVGHLARGPRPDGAGVERAVLGRVGLVGRQCRLRGQGDGADAGRARLSAGRMRRRSSPASRCSTTSSRPRSPSCCWRPRPISRSARCWSAASSRAACWRWRLPSASI